MCFQKPCPSQAQNQQRAHGKISLSPILLPINYTAKWNAINFIVHVEIFFKPGDFPCHIYCRTRDKTDEYNTRGREFIEALWRECAAYLDPDTLQRATLSMPTVFWELYLAHTLNSSGISVQRQARTRQNQKGPDLFAANPDVWIEQSLRCRWNSQPCSAGLTIQSPFSRAS